ncbi:MAG: hypothetical protein CMJ18_15625, partial [Phycisphaeraceae bacterium]|nr:hypothetical protein [Phycisphaeraceae bacterium]
MSSEQSSEQTSRPPADTSIQRRVKFGTNVALTIVVAIVIVVLINAMAYRYLKTMRVDATYSRRYSLSRQTINLARSLKKQYRIVTLIAQSVEEIEHAKSLIGEYERYSDKLTVEHLNPITSRGDQFKKTLLARYETRLEPVREAIEEGRKAVTEAAALLTPYADRLEALRKSGALTGIEQVGFIRQVSSFVERYPQGTSDLDRVIDQKLELTLPDYDGVLRDLREMVEVPEQNLAQIVTIFSAWIDDELTASALKEQVIPLRDEMGQTRKQLADRVSRLRGLEGLDDYNRVRRELENPDTVMIMSDDEVRVIALASMFRRDTSQEAQQQAPEQKDEALLFTGEEQITGALVGMEMEQKPMVIFVSSAQQPATGPRGVFAGVAERLRTMNFQVEDWNPSGQRPPIFPGQQPQPPTPQPPAEPEPGQ